MVKKSIIHPATVGHVFFSTNPPPNRGVQRHGPRLQAAIEVVLWEAHPIHPQVARHHLPLSISLHGDFNWESPNRIGDFKVPIISQFFVKPYIKKLNPKVATVAVLQTKNISKHRRELLKNMVRCGDDRSPWWPYFLHESLLRSLKGQLCIQRWRRPNPLHRDGKEPPPFC